MRFILTTLLFSFLTFSSKAQYFESGSEWRFGLRQSGPTSYLKESFEKQTTIDGKQAYKILFSRYNYEEFAQGQYRYELADTSHYYLIYEDSVLTRVEKNRDDMVLIDEKLNIGDTLKSSNPSFDIDSNCANYNVVIQEKKDTTINNKKRLKIVLSMHFKGKANFSDDDTSYSKKATYISGFGYVDYKNFQPYYMFIRAPHCDGFMPPYDVVYDCYQINGQSFLGKDNCDFYETLNTEEQNFSKGIEIYPNPASDRLFLESKFNKIENIKILNLQGQLVLEEASDKLEEVDISTLYPGMYFIVINNQHNSSRKLIVE